MDRCVYDEGTRKCCWPGTTRLCQARHLGSRSSRTSSIQLRNRAQHNLLTAAHRNFCRRENDLFWKIEARASLRPGLIRELSISVVKNRHEFCGAPTALFKTRQTPRLDFRPAKDSRFPPTSILFSSQTDRCLFGFTLHQWRFSPSVSHDALGVGPRLHPSLIRASTHGPRPRVRKLDPSTSSRLVIKILCLA